jgi:predicted nucleic acid-binding protein
MDQVLIDTNILVYAYDSFESKKQIRSQEVIDSLTRSGRGRLSTQVLGEFINASARSRRRLLTIEQALVEMKRFADTFTVFDVTLKIAMNAIDGVRLHQLPYYDAQLWATARLNQVGTIFSEDFQHGRSIEGVQFLNPLLPGFDLTPWA